MFEEIRLRIPSLSAWMESCYSCHSILRLGQDTIPSCCGVQQGDPLGPLGFALTLHPIVEHIREQVPGLALNSWYLDDGTLIGSPDQLAAALDIIEREGPTVGLNLNRSKSLLFLSSFLRKTPPSLRYPQISQSRARDSPYWAAPSALQPSVKRSFTEGF